MKLLALLVHGIIVMAVLTAERKDLSQADDDSVVKCAKEDAAVLCYGKHQGFSLGSNMLESAWHGAVNLVFTKTGLEQQHNLVKDSSAKTLYGAELDKEYLKILDAGGLENYDPKATSTPTPAPVTSTIAPMPKEMQAKIKAERIALEEQKRKLFEKREAKREANGDFSQAPGLTREQREAAEIRWAEKNAQESIKGAKPFPQ